MTLDTDLPWASSFGTRRSLVDDDTDRYVLAKLGDESWVAEITARVKTEQWTDLMVRCRRWPWAYCCLWRGQ